MSISFAAGLVSERVMKNFFSFEWSSRVGVRARVVPC